MIDEMQMQYCTVLYCIYEYSCTMLYISIHSRLFSSINLPISNPERFLFYSHTHQPVVGNHSHRTKHWQRSGPSSSSQAGITLFLKKIFYCLSQLPPCWMDGISKIDNAHSQLARFPTHETCVEREITHPSTIPRLRFGRVWRRERGNSGSEVWRWRE
ncbi:hypothetical protein L873DRAFT_718217 [Choiromyces venosus 120613-1]|uniref:Uncharacterized protein n=1 Tax=Choiromyces venosus 120613-1 TaxID=1336337 RepID=A0A3N4JRK9_9PEZI|nr:hypothetical protein L873DRAFT_718217 [Choiromyces venosus 120613-1]